MDEGRGVIVLAVKEWAGGCEHQEHVRDRLTPPPGLLPPGGQTGHD